LFTSAWRAAAMIGTTKVMIMMLMTSSLRTAGR
jgi:hypothetical protein